MNRSNMFGHYNETLLRTAVAVPEAPATAAPASSAKVPPAVGDLWGGQGGIYAGLTILADGRAAHLILAADAGPNANWADAGKWAAGITADGNSDFALPSRFDGLALLKRLRDVIGTGEVIWLDEEIASDPACAWYQLFGGGTQGWYRKGSKLRARAVRRLPI